MSNSFIHIKEYLTILDKSILLGFGDQGYTKNVLLPLSKFFIKKYLIVDARLRVGRYNEECLYCGVKHSFSR